MKRETIISDIKASGGADESARMYSITDIITGKTQLVIEKTITERYDVTEYEKVDDLYERLTCGSGRKVIKLNDIAHHYNPNS